MKKPIKIVVVSLAGLVVLVAPRAENQALEVVSRRDAQRPREPAGSQEDHERALDPLALRHPTDSPGICSGVEGREGVIAEVAARAVQSTLDDLGSATIIADTAAMRHETQGTRLFRS